MKVNFEYVRGLKSALDAINEMPFEDIEWYEDGKHVEMSKRKSEAWLEDGMQNTDFPDQHYLYML